MVSEIFGAKNKIKPNSQFQKIDWTLKYLLEENNIEFSSHMKRGAALLT